MTTPIPRVAIWCAVSSDRQAFEDKVSLPDQLRQGQEWAQHIGGEVVRVYEVVHTRSDYLFEDAKREIPPYQQLQDDIEDGVFTHLWCRGQDRIARSRAVAASIDYLLEKAGVLVYSAKTKTTADTSTFAGQLIGAVERLYSNEEIRELKRRWWGGMRGRIKRGLVASQWPYGYTVKRDELGRTIGAEFNESAGAVRYATELFLRGISYERIAVQLNATPYQTDGGNDWGWRTVYNWMHNDTYGGYPACGDIVAAERSDKYPALWDEDTFRRVKRERSRRRKGGRAPTTVLSTLVSCARCGGPMTHARTENRAYFRCTNHARKRVKCHANSTREEVVIDAVDAHIARLKAHSVEELRTALFDDGNERAALEQERADLAQRLSAVQQRRARLADAVAEGAISFDTARAGEAKIAADEEALEWELQRVDAALMLLPDDVEKQARIELVASLPDSIRLLQQDEARMLLRDIGIVVWCEDRKVVRVEPEIG